MRQEVACPLDRVLPVCSPPFHVTPSYFNRTVCLYWMFFTWYVICHLPQCRSFLPFSRMRSLLLFPTASFKCNKLGATQSLPDYWFGFCIIKCITHFHGEFTYTTVCNMLANCCQIIVHLTEDISAFKPLKNTDMLPPYLKQRNTSFRKPKQELESVTVR